MFICQELLQLLVILLFELGLAIGFSKLHGSALPVCPSGNVHDPLCCSFCLPGLPHLKQTCCLMHALLMQECVHAGNACVEIGN